MTIEKQKCVDIRQRFFKNKIEPKYIRKAFKVPILSSIFMKYCNIIKILTHFKCHILSHFTTMNAATVVLNNNS